jgi:hypothetical protein
VRGVVRMRARPTVAILICVGCPACLSGADGRARVRPNDGLLWHVAGRVVRWSPFLYVALGALLPTLAAPAWAQVTPTAIGNQRYPWKVGAHVDADGTARVGYLTGGDWGRPAVL